MAEAVGVGGDGMDYAAFARTVEEAGFFTIDERERGRLVCASKRRAAGGFTGNSFWVAKRGAAWFLGVWGGRIYRAPEGRIVEVSVAWLTREPDKTHYDVDDHTRRTFALDEVAEEQFDAAGA